MKLIKVIRLMDTDFILKGLIPDSDSLEGVEVTKVYSRKKNVDLKPFLSENTIFLLEKELRKL